jgi:hypothetical protein
MNLIEKIVLYPPTTSDKKGNIVQPPPLELAELTVRYIDYEKDKIFFAEILGIPNKIILFQGKEYTDLGLIKQDVADSRLLKILEKDPQKVLQSLFPKTLEEHPFGPGTIITKMLKAIGIKSEVNCSCRKHAIEMNERGNDWCEENIDTIVSWMQIEAAKRKLPFSQTVASLMIKKAIKKSRKLLEIKNEV